MGAAPSIVATGNDALVAELKEMVSKEEGYSPFAVNVLESEYKRIITYNNFLSENNVDRWGEVIEDAPPPFCGTPDLLYDRLKTLYDKAVNEEQTPLEDCTLPSVIVYKYESMEAELKAEYKQSILDAVLTVEAQKSASAPKVEDYSKSFGGTEADSKNEKEAAALLRGETKEEEKTNDPKLAKPTTENNYELHSLRTTSECWCKYLGASGCFMYFHILTKEVASLKPDDYEDPPAVEADKAAEVEEKDVANGLPNVRISDMPAEVDRIVGELRRTPLLIDRSEAQVVRTFYSYKAMLEDVSSLTIPFGKSGVKKEEVMERCRVKLVSALKTGGTFVLYLGDVSIEHCDFKTKLCKKTVFPKETFVEGGHKLLGPNYDPKYKHIYREEDLEQGQAITRDGFRVVVISSLDPYEYEALLADTIPLGYMTPIMITD